MTALYSDIKLHITGRGGGGGNYPVFYDMVAVASSLSWVTSSEISMLKFKPIMKKAYCEFESRWQKKKNALRLNAFYLTFLKIYLLFYIVFIYLFIY